VALREAAGPVPRGIIRPDEDSQEKG
jgi:hypothetical protein